MTQTYDTDSRALIAAAHAAMERRDWTAAISLWTRAAALGPRRRVFRGLARAQLKRKDYEAATRVLRTALGHFPDTTAFLDLLGEALMYQRLWQEAVPVWEARLGADETPPPMQVVLFLASAYRRLGREAEAAALLAAHGQELERLYGAETAAVLHRGRAGLPESRPGAYWITGPSGTGKTTVGHLLGALGFETVDGDKELGQFTHVDTGEVTGATAPYPITASFLAENAWTWDLERLAHILSACRDDVVFIFGGSRNAGQVRSHFAGHLALHAPPEVLRKRLQAREPMRFADGSPSLLKVLKSAERLRRGSAAKVISSDQPMFRVMSDVLAHIRQDAPGGGQGQ